MGLAKALAHLVGFSCGHAGHILDELHDLLLPHDYPVAALQSAPLQRVVVLPLRPMPVALYELGHGAALNADAGPDESDLVREVEEVA